MKLALAYFWPTFAFLLIVAGVVAFASPQQAQSKDPFVKWESRGGWLFIDQVGDGFSLTVRRSAITMVAYHSPRSVYAKTVYRESGHLVVLELGVGEYRLRCPNEKVSKDLISFITEE